MMIRLMDLLYSRNGAIHRIAIIAKVNSQHHISQKDRTT